MGCASSNETRERQKHLVIVGFSYAGFNLIQKVKEDFRITIIDKKDYFEWTSGTPHSIHDEEYAKNNWVSYDQMINKNKVFGKNVRYTQALLDELVDDNTIKIKNTKGKSQGEVESSAAKEIKFDYLVLATGHVYTLNEDTESIFNMYSQRQRGQLYDKYRKQVDDASSVLVIGGGATGVEMVGEVLMKYGDEKKVTIATAGDKLLSQYPDEVSQKATEHFESKDNVTIKLNTKASPGDSLAREHDFVINCVGTRIHTPYLDAHYKDFKDDRGRIFVNKYFQVTSINPLTNASSGVKKTLDNIFCFGDACLTKMNEPKNIPSIFQSSFIVAHNLLKSAEGEYTSFQEMPDNTFFLSAVYFDDTKGAITIGTNVMENPNMFKDKGGFEIPYFTYMRNDKDGQKNWDGYVDQVKGMMGL